MLMRLMAENVDCEGKKKSRMVKQSLKEDCLTPKRR